MTDNFLNIYQAVQAISDGNSSHAISLLTGIDDVFASELLYYLKNKELISKTVELFFTDPNPWIIWGNTQFAKTTDRVTLDLARQALAKIPIPTEITLFDIGTGEAGLLVGLINQVLKSRPVSKINLILLDLSDSLLKQAGARCKREINNLGTVYLINNKIQELTPQEKALINQADIWLTLSAATLHHLPYDQKAQVLQYLSKQSDYLLISELQGNHDQPEMGSQELCQSVYDFYSTLMHSVLALDCPMADKRLCLDTFITAEAMGILFNHRNERQNYHMLLDQWLKVSEQSGYKLDYSCAQKICADNPQEMLMLFQSKR